jgi:hypothetical protein
MDPWLESPSIWPDLHDRLANDISIHLNLVLPRPYYARLEARPQVEAIDIEQETASSRRIIPDVTVLSSKQRLASNGGVAVLDARTTVSPFVEVEYPSEPIQHKFVEIRDPRHGHKLITLIEIASPANKRHGEERELYEKKFGETYQSDASIIEIDLLRGGERILHDALLEAHISLLKPPADYLVLVNRSWRRKKGLSYQVFPFGLRDPLPCIPVPLREPEAEVLLDLQVVFQKSYDGGPYRRGAVNYAEPPDPPLRHEDVIWAHERLMAAGLVPASAT